MKDRHVIARHLQWASIEYQQDETTDALKWVRAAAARVIRTDYPNADLLKALAACITDVVVGLMAEDYIDDFVCVISDELMTALRKAMAVVREHGSAPAWPQGGWIATSTI
jgi:hypothetical protein